MTVRTAKPSDAGPLVEIYNHYISNTQTTFEEVELSQEEIVSRMAAVEAQGLPWLVLEEDGNLVGYSYAGRWRERSAYRFSVEVTVYLAPGYEGGGYGTRLYSRLFELLREQSVHVAIGGITLPNPASVALHEKMGMKKVAEFPEVGFKQDQWLDVGYWQINF